MFDLKTGKGKRFFCLQAIGVIEKVFLLIINMRVICCIIE